MFLSQTAVRSCCFLAMAAGLILGCANFDRYDPLKIFPTEHRPNPEQARAHRQKFQIDGSPLSFNWLMANLVENGMTVAAVSEAIGESGERYFEDRDMKTNGGQYQETDVGYKWGPDTNGRSVVLFFRDDKLVNFDPTEFRH